MQIILIQAEIEQALRDYMARQIRVADGMSMSIELSATRGAEGFKATIDILPIAQASETPVRAPVSAPLPAPAAVVPAPSRVTTEDLKRMQAEEAAKEAAEPEAGNDDEAESANADEAPAVEAANAEPEPPLPATGTSTGAVDGAAPPVNPAGRSLFRGLKSPRG